MARFKVDRVISPTWRQVGWIETVEAKCIRNVLSVCWPSLDDSHWQYIPAPIGGPVGPRARAYRYCGEDSYYVVTALD